jgi:hypothetical protein
VSAKPPSRNSGVQVDPLAGTRFQQYRLRKIGPRPAMAMVEQLAFSFGPTSKLPEIRFLIETDNFRTSAPLTDVFALL